MVNNDVKHVLCYTREPMDELIYASKLAYSMHLAVSEDGTEFMELNQNSGVLFAKATQNSDGTLNAKSLKNPYLFETANDSFGVIAIRTEADGSDDIQSKGMALLFESKDLIQYKEIGLIDLSHECFLDEAICNYDSEIEKYIVSWRTSTGDHYLGEIKDIFRLGSVYNINKAESFQVHSPNTKIEGALERNVLRVDKKIYERLVLKLTVPEHVRIELPETVIASSEDEVNAVKAKAIYSDRTVSEKKIDWDFSGVSWNIPGIYKITGEVHQDHYTFPMAVERADPCIGKWKGKYYFIATNDTDGNHSLYIREADSIPALVHAKEHKILDTTMYPQIGNLLWAPEFHIMNETLYLFHSATPGEFVKEHSHIMVLKENGNPINASDWGMPIPVIKKNGDPLFTDGITLDMTTFEVRGKQYAVWAQRQFSPVDQGSWLYIAELSKQEPWRLCTDPVLISMPEYGWANNRTFVDEGPYALIRENKIFLTFSSALIDAAYTVGILTADIESDLLKAESWVKGNYPILTSRSVEGEYGPGHNAYVIDEDGVVWNTYHAKPFIDQPRCSGIRRVHFDIDGYPVLSLTEEKDLNPELKHVSTNLNLILI